MAQDETLARLATLESHVRDHVRTILGVASAAPPGGDFHWDRLLAHYATTPDDGAVRLQHAADAGQARGATLVEVKRVIAAMAQQARGELDRITAGSAEDVDLLEQVIGIRYQSVDLAGRIGAMREWLAKLPDEQAGQYAAAVCPPKQAVAASVNSVFANATATAKLTPWANVKIDPTRVLSCHVCGAPQEVALDFVCKFCRNPMVKGGAS